MALKKSDVNYVYQNYLGRDPDEGAVADLVGQDISRAQLADTILNSDEYKSMTPQDQISRQFQNVLGRGPSDAELQRVMGMDDYYNYSSTTMGGAQPERLDFRPSVLRNDLMKLPEANLVRVFKNYLGRLPDEEAYRNYLTQFEAEPHKGVDTMGQQSRREQKLVDTNYDYAMDPKRIEEVGWSPEAQEYINSKFEAEARRYAEEKGIELPDDFSALAQLRNPYQDNRAGMEGLNLMNPISFKEGQYTPADSAADYDVYSGADAYDLPTYAMWFSQAGTAAFTDEDKAQRMIDLYGPAAAVDAYAANPGNFVRDAAAGVYVNNWLEQNIDPNVTAEGKNADKLAALGVRYQDLSKRAIDLGADPEDIAQTTAQKVDKVAGDYQTYYNDTHENTFFKFLLAAGGLFLGAYGLSQVLGAAGAGATAGATAAAAPSVGGGFVGGGYGSIGPAGFTSAAATPAYVGTKIPSTIFKTPTMPGYVSPGGAPAAGGTELLGGGLKMPGSVAIPEASGVGNIKVAAGQGLAPNVGAKVGAGAQQIGTGSVGIKAPSWFLPSTPTPGGLSSFVNKAKEIYDKASDLSDVLGGGKQQQQNRSGAPIYRNPAELFPVSNTMMSPEEILARRTSRPTFVGGLEAVSRQT
jgi:hypothetical protein